MLNVSLLKSLINDNSQLNFGCKYNPNLRLKNQKPLTKRYTPNAKSAKTPKIAIMESMHPNFCQNPLYGFTCSSTFRKLETNKLLILLENQ